MRSRLARPLVALAAALASFALLAADGSDAPRVLRVGPRAMSIADAARMAHSGDTVEIEAGEYDAPAATWGQDRLTLRGVGGPVRLVARGGQVAEGKAIWVIRGDDVRVEGIEFSGAVVSDHNGAGIRHEGGRLVIRDCRFTGNEMGILTWNDPRGDLDVEGSEFDHNAIVSSDPRDVAHQIYVGAIGRFRLHGSYFHDGAVGHLVKSRARENDIAYNRITDEAGGHSSYEIDLSNGGVARVVGNIIEQSANAENFVLVSFGAEGYRGGGNRLELVNNTLVDDFPGGGVFLRVRPGDVEVVAANNLLVGKGSLEAAGPGRYIGNVHAQPQDFAGTSRYDYRLRRGAPQAGKAVAPERQGLTVARPDREYRHPRSEAAISRDEPYSPGALQSLAP